MISVFKTNYKKSQWKLGIFSDLHIDSLNCDRKLLKKHLDLYNNETSIIFINGDLFDVMQGKGDKRGSRDSLRTEYKTDAYVNKVLNDICEFLLPYAKRILVIGKGNHETKFKKYKDIDLTELLVQMLNDKTGADIKVGGHEGYIVFQNEFQKKVQTYRIYYNHGSGGNSPVTKGFIDVNRKAVWLSNIDLITTGHTHSAFTHPFYKESISRLNTKQLDLVWYVKTPSYLRKEESEGYAAESGFAPAPLGHCEIQFDFSSSNGYGSKVSLVVG